MFVFSVLSNLFQLHKKSFANNISALNFLCQALKVSAKVAMKINGCHINLSGWF